MLVGDCVRVQGDKFLGELPCKGGGDPKPTHVVKEIGPTVCAGYDIQIFRYPEGSLEDALSNTDTYCLNKL
ncbi:hypothetical protein [Paractinoplanes lichenicola]|uniref:Uncharacterized protein n=1 Tax=Paractinoplanes lichenicola TaxID=2802976 RepID=A0ABS1VK60_9ACTN|nr:hypothetical protein [Actinoplanes lichenicola]MBL7254157.1 hypothetical protein [Actinoplanes lichenicola]